MELLAKIARVVVWLAGGVAAGIALAADASEPRVPLLEGVAPRAAATAAGSAVDPARRLPDTATVCMDEKARRCWTIPGESDCGPATALVYRTVIVAPDRADVATALAQCEQKLREEGGHEDE